MLYATVFLWIGLVYKLMVIFWMVMLGVFVTGRFVVVTTSRWGCCVYGCSFLVDAMCLVLVGGCCIECVLVVVLMHWIC